MTSEPQSPQRRGAVVLNRPAPLSYRVAARMSAVGFLAASLWYGLAAGGHLDYEGSPWHKIPGKISSLFGYAAGDVRITGLVHHDPEQVLAAINVQLGDSLLGFDAIQARDLLQNLDWVRSAKVLRRHPNELDIVVVEREPFAVWQREGAYYVIDRSGSAMSSFAPGGLHGLLLITGEGAQTEAARLVNLLESQPAIRSRVRAASRVGLRRWTLHLDNGVKIALPEFGAEVALATAARLDQEQNLLSKGIAMLDLRLAGRITVAVAEAARDDVKVSRK